MPIIKSFFLNFLINLYLDKHQILYIHKNKINFMKNKFHLNNKNLFNFLIKHLYFLE